MPQEPIIHHIPNPPKYECPYCDFEDIEKMVTVDHIITCLNLASNDIVNSVHSLQHFLILQCCFNKLIEDSAENKELFTYDPTLWSTKDSVITMENVKEIQEVFLKQFDKSDEIFIAGWIKLLINEKWNNKLQKAFMNNELKLAPSFLLVDSINFHFLQISVLIYISFLTLQHTNPEFNTFQLALLNFEHDEDMVFTFNNNDMEAPVKDTAFLRIFAKILNVLLRVIYVDEDQFAKLKEEIDVLITENFIEAEN